MDSSFCVCIRSPTVFLLLYYRPCVFFYFILFKLKEPQLLCAVCQLIFPGYGFLEADPAGSTLFNCSVCVATLVLQIM